MTIRLILGDCRDVLREFDPESVDAIVTDPPYGIGFMGREWDTFGPESVRRREKQLERKGPYKPSEAWPEKRGAPRVKGGGAPLAYDESTAGNRAFQAWCTEWAAEALRVLKPGGYLVAFGGPRTAHRLTAGIEDAGFQIRDQLMWLHGQGYPKSHNLCRCRPSRPGAPDAHGWALCESCGRQVGLGTALKPAWEPIVLARKPLIGTVAANVAQHGTGALNINACRLPIDDDAYARNASGDRGHAGREANGTPGFLARVNGGTASAVGRWPANLALDEAAAAELDAAVGELRSGANPTRRGSNKFANTYGAFIGQQECVPARGADTDGPSRYFYCAKASATERNAGLEDLAKRSVHDPSADDRVWDIPGSNSTPRANNHPTVKPLALCRWLIRLVTPPNGLVADLFVGSGSFGVACVLEQRDFVGIDREAEWLEIARRRIEHAQGPLLADVSVA